MTQIRLFMDDANLPIPKLRWESLTSTKSGLGRTFNLPDLHALLLYNRGIRRPSEVEAFISADERLANDPNLFSDMARAAERLVNLSKQRKTIAVYGDFDVDGISGTALLCRTVEELGGKTLPYIPNRMVEGHGLNETAIRQLASAGAELLVTVDCGTTASTEVALARSLDMDVIVTDHHIASENVPRGIPLLNPGIGDGYPYKGLTGAGVALKLAQAAYSLTGLPVPGTLLELAALGTIADVGPLTGENRFIVSSGMKHLRETDNIGIKALVERGNFKLSQFSARDLSFSIIPWLNAAGRMDDPNISLNLLTTDDVQEAADLAQMLEGFNVERRRATDKGVREAEEQVSSRNLITMPGMVVYSPDWHPGIVGLIAGRLAERYGRPVVAGMLSNGQLKASVRGPAGISVIEAIRTSGVPFIRMGGHSQAAGFAVDQKHIGDFERMFPTRVADQGWDPQTIDVVRYDCELSLSEVNDVNYMFISSLAPFGEGNPVPSFLTRGVKVEGARTVGRHDDHLKLRLSSKGVHLEAIAFRQGDKLVDLTEVIDLVYTINLNEWGGRRQLELKVIDIRQAV